MQTRSWEVNAPFHRKNFITETECLVCKRIHENIDRSSKGLQPHIHQANINHYGCPKPLNFKGESSDMNLQRADTSHWAYSWQSAQDEAEVLSLFWSEGRYNFSKHEVAQRMSKLRYLKKAEKSGT